MKSDYPFPPKEDRSYGFFGYEGNMCDSAMISDNQEMLKGCIDNGWIDKDSITLDNRSIYQVCELRKAKKCMQMLSDLGWK